MNMQRAEENMWHKSAAHLTMGRRMLFPMRQRKGQPPLFRLENGSEESGADIVGGRTGAGGAGTVVELADACH